MQLMYGIFAVVVLVAIGLAVEMFIFRKRRRNSPKQAKERPLSKMDKWEILAKGLSNLNDRVRALETMAGVDGNGLSIACESGNGQGDNQQPLTVYSLEEALEQARTMDVDYASSGNGHSPVAVAEKEVSQPVQESQEGEVLPVNPVKLQVMEVLRNGPAKTGDIAKGCNLTSPKVSRTMAALYKEGIVAKNHKEEWVLSGSPGPQN